MISDSIPQSTLMKYIPDDNADESNLMRFAPEWKSRSYTQIELPEISQMENFILEVEFKLKYKTEFSLTGLGDIDKPESSFWIPGTAAVNVGLPASVQAV